MSGRKRVSYGAVVNRKKILSIILFVCVAVIFGIIFYFIYYKYIPNLENNNKTRILEAWRKGNYKVVFDSTSMFARVNVEDTFWPIMKGISAYYLGSAQITANEFQKYNDEAIFKLRRSILLNSNNMESQIYYILGKAYYSKGPYYCDLAVRFLNEAYKKGFSSDDLFEYLGLAYAEIKDFRNSIVAFTKNLSDDPSDLLLLAISRSYIELNDPNSAKAYLYRCIEKSKDITVIIQAKLLLARMFRALGENSSTEKEYLDIIELDNKNADAHFALGDIYAQSGDVVRARAEWRKAIRIDPTHVLARARLNI